MASRCTAGDPTASPVIAAFNLPASIPAREANAPARCRVLIER
jgi:hypothetical protein